MDQNASAPIHTPLVPGYQSQVYGKVRVDTSINRRAITAADNGPTTDFLTTMRDRFQMVVNAEAVLRAKMLEDVQFRSGESQWDAKSRADRARDGRPCITINRIPQFLRQVTNAQRASRPSMTVTPRSNEATQAVAEVLQGTCRAIEADSDADVAYSTGCDAQVTMGRGYWRIITEYEDYESLKQVIRIRRVPNALSVFVDPATVLADASDARFAFVIEDIPKPEFVATYGAEYASTLDVWMAQNANVMPDWMPEGRVRVAEYFYKDYVEEHIVEIEFDGPDGGRVTESFPKQVVDDLEPGELETLGWKVGKSRLVRRPQCKWAKCVPTAVLEGNAAKTEGRNFPSSYIPVVQVIGDEINIDGNVDLRGMVRDAKDPARMLSFWATAITEVIALTPRAPYIGVAGQFKGHEDKWNNANRTSYGYLEYQPMSAYGTLAPPPQRQQWEPQIQAMVEAFQLADNDLKAVMGLYDASLGKTGPEQSGRAILARKQQGDVGNSNYSDNLGRAVRYTTRIMIDMIPRVMSPVQIQHILGVDDKRRAVILHAGAAPEADIQAAKMRYGISEVYNIGVGRYDVVVSDGPSYLTRRQEAVQSMISLIQAYPAAAPLIMDLVVSNMDWPGAADIAARLRKAVPPQVLETADGAPAIPPQVQAVIAQLKQEIAKLQMDELANKIQIASKERIAALDRQSREWVADQQTRALLVQAEAKIDAAKTMALIQAQIGEMDTRLQQSHEAALNTADAEHELAKLRLELASQDAPDQAASTGQPAPQPAAATTGAAPAPDGNIPSGSA